MDLAIKRFIRRVANVLQVVDSIERINTKKNRASNRIAVSASKSIEVLVAAASILNTEVVYFINAMIACYSKSWSKILC